MAEGNAASSAHARLFLATGLPGGLVPVLESYLRAVFPGGVPGRPVPARNWHLTLRFLGNSGPADRARLEAELDRIAPAASFAVEMDVPGAFPSPGRARVLWLGCGAGGAELARLAGAMDAAALRAGFSPGDHECYTPHLTLSRLARPTDLRAALEAAPPAALCFRVDHYALFASISGAGGVRYEPLRRWSLV